MERHTEVAKVIMGQLSTGTRMACGMRDFIASPDKCGTLICRVLNGRSSLKIELEASDTYTVKHVKMNRKYEQVVIEEMNDVYADSLNEVIYRMLNK